MARKTRKMNGEGIDSLPNDKPGVYKLIDKQGHNIYTGSAGRFSIRDRLRAHLRGGQDSIPGAVTVEFEQTPSIADARRKETNIISRTKPKYNKRGK